MARVREAFPRRTVKPPPREASGVTKVPRAVALAEVGDRCFGELIDSPVLDYRTVRGGTTTTR
jgi:hypothetical protein